MSDRFAGGIKAGSTGVTIPVVLRRTTDNTELIGVQAAGVTASFRRSHSAPATIAMVDLSQVDSPWSAGGWKEVDATNRPGEYRFDIPDAAFSPGTDWVTIAVKVAGAYAFYERFALESKGAAEIFAQLPLGFSSFVSPDNAGVASLLSSVGSNLSTTVGAIKMKTDNLPVNPASAGPVQLADDGLDLVMVEAGVNARQALSPILAASAGVLAGASTATITIAAANNPSTNRITATVDASGNRSAVTLNLPE